MTSNFPKTLNKIAYSQFAISIVISLFFFSHKDIASGLIISGFTSYIYTQLIKYGNYNTLYALYGYPIRIVFSGIPCAILIHKFHPNLIALVFGFILSQIVFFYFIFKYAKENENN